MAQLLQNVGFAEKAVNFFLRDDDGRLKRLDGERSAIRFRHREIDDAHPPAAKLFQDR